MSETLLPLFPLQLVLFPGESLKLHIFEPRYKMLVSECVESGGTFGIPTYFDKRVTEYGTEARIVEVYNTYATGEMDIKVEGQRVFHLNRFLKTAPGKPYAAGEVAWIENIPEPDSALEPEIWELFERLHDLLNTGHEREQSPVANLSFALGHELGFSLGSKLELLGTPAEADRQRLVLTHLRTAVLMLEALAETKRRIAGNGQFHRFPEVDL